MKTVLVLGSEGMLGQALAEEFFDYKVIALDRPEVDIASEKNVQEKIFELKPDLVINAAAYNAVNLIESDDKSYQLARAINGLAVGYIAVVCKNLDIPFVHYSSDYVFDGEDKNGYTEDAKANPINKYGETKLLGEKEIKKCDKYYLIRLSRLFGKPAKSEGAKKSFVELMLDFAKTGIDKKLDLVNEEYSCQTYAPDLAKLTKRIYEEAMPFGIYHGSNSGACTWYDLGNKIFEIKKMSPTVTPVKTNSLSRSAKRPAHSELLNTKLPPQRSWEEALEEYLGT